MSPATLDEFLGQRHVLGQGKMLRQSLEQDKIRSLVLYGPPGCGKSALGRLLAKMTQASYQRLNAVTSGVAELRKVVLEAKKQRDNGLRTILFLDEIHRYNRTQQDALLPELESGLITLVGATTQNPFVTLQRALLSRSLVVEFHPLEEADLLNLADRALEDQDKGLAGRFSLDPKARKALASSASGDARKLLNLLESSADIALASRHSPVAGRSPEASTTNDERTATSQDTSNEVCTISSEHIQEALQRPLVPHDRQGDEHYNVISAFIKSLRGSHPDAALHWLARMLEGGEDPRFIARRMVILASEDVGNADPRGLQIAVAAAQALDLVGLPEAALNLAQAAVYLALAPKSNASAVALWKAQEEVRSGKARPVPKSLRDSHFSGHEKLGHGQGYEYDHDAPSHFSNQDFGVPREAYLKLSDMGYEKKLKDWMAGLLKNARRS